MRRRSIPRGLALLAAVALATTLSACAPDTAEPEPAPPAPSSAPSDSERATADPTPTATSVAVDLPSDCRAILSPDVLAQLEGIPLNAPGTGVAGGVQSDGSLLCLWRDPAADTTSLSTTISGVARGPALELLNSLAAEEGFTCYAPDGGTRCERTWQNERYQVTDGRTLFWRDDILIDTEYSNLAPTGYTAAVIAAVFG